MQRWGCLVVMLCVQRGAAAGVGVGLGVGVVEVAGAGAGAAGGACMVLPHVRCEGAPDVPLVTLHLAPRDRDRAADFASVACPCP